MPSSRQHRVLFRIREFRAEDLGTLAEIDAQCFPPGIAYGRKELTHYIRRPDALTLVAESTSPDLSPIAGFLVAHKVLRKSRQSIGHIVTIDVLPEARRSGLGSQLMGEAEQRLRGAGCEAVFLEVAVNNLAALQFYKRRGYFVLKTLPRYYQDELDALLMLKPLEP
ncbi:MAG: GNAT family N-acetyltransferase [Candidatus Korobacteraceae bacterium]